MPAKHGAAGPESVPVVDCVIFKLQTKQLSMVTMAGILFVTSGSPCLCPRCARVHLIKDSESARECKAGPKTQTCQDSDGNPETLIEPCWSLSQPHRIFLLSTPLLLLQTSPLFLPP